MQLANEPASYELFQGSFGDPAILPGEPKDFPQFTLPDIVRQSVKVNVQPVTDLAGGQPAGRSCSLVTHKTEAVAVFPVIIQRCRERQAFRASIGSCVIRISFPSISTL